MAGPLGAQPAHATTRVAKKAQAADELDFAQTQLRSSGSPLMIKVIQGAAVAGTAGASIAYVLAQQRKAEEAKKREAQEYLNMVMRAEQKIVDGDGGMNTGATVAEDDPFAIAALREPVAPPPLEPPPKKNLLNLFGTRKPTVSVPTVDDLTMASTPQAALCKTLAWSLRAPIDIAAASTPEEGAELNLDEDGPAALAISILEELDAAKNETIGAGLSLKEMGRCLEQVGRAMLLQRVDAAIAVLNQPEAFAEQAKLLCLFAQNAEAVATFLGVERLVGEVLYEGAEGRRPLERLYAGCLRLAAPELLASMGMGLGGEDGEGAASTGVGLDTVEKLRPLLKVSDQKGEKLVQEVMQQQMMAAMGPAGEGDETKQIAQSVAMPGAGAWQEYAKMPQS